MTRFNIAFLVVNILLLSGVLYQHFTAQITEQKRFELLKPILLRSYRDLNMKLAHEDPKDLDELLAPLDALAEGLSR